MVDVMVGLVYAGIGVLCLNESFTLPRKAYRYNKMS